MTTVSSLSSQSSISDVISSLMASERQPITALQVESSALQTKKGMYSDLDGKLSALRTKAEALADVVSNELNARVASGSDSSILTASAAGSAAIANHDIHVYQLARHHTMLSDKVAGGATTIRDAVGAGEKTFSITVDGVATEVSVAIGEADDNETVLANVAAAINDAFAAIDAGVTASALQIDSTDFRLMVRGDNSGMAYKMDLADVSGGLLAGLHIDNESAASGDASGGYVYADSELMADLSVDGVRITRDANVISDAIPGVTLTLRGAQAEDAGDVALTVGANMTAIRDSLQSFINTYNDTLNYVRSKTKVDAGTGVRGALAGDFVYLNLISEMRSLMASVVSTATVGGPNTLSQIGITPGADGALSISDTSAFEEAINSTPAAVTALFNSSEGLAARLKTMLDPFVKTGGYVDIDRDAVSNRISSINTRVKQLEARATIREQDLIKQYSQMQETLALLNAQQNFINTLNQQLS